MKHLVILGAGFGGLCAALNLGRQLSGGEWKIILVDRNSYHLYYPRLYELIIPNRGAACVIEVKEVLKGKKVEFIQNEAATIDCKGKRVVFTDGSTLSFEYLILALGADTDYFGISGLHEYACTLKSLKDAEMIRNKVEEFLKNAKLQKSGTETTEKFSVVIGGAGATGVEVASELAYLFRDVPRGSWSITLVEALRNVLWMFPPGISQYAHKRLEELGVTLMLDTCIKEVVKEKDVPRVEVVLAPRPLKPGEKEEELVCSFLPEHEKQISADLLLWAGGVRANPLVAKCGLPTDRKGRIEVDEHLRVKGEERMYAIGDNALLMDPSVNQPVPGTAQAALLEGKIAAANVISAVKGHPTMMLYPFPKFPAVVPLSDMDAVALFKGKIFRGVFAWFLRKAADFRYYNSILPWWRAMKLCFFV